MADTIKASHITDHPFEPRTVPVMWTLEDGREVRLPRNRHLCGYKQCGMAEAAHRETTVQR